MDIVSRVALAVLLALAACAVPELESEEHDANFYNLNAQRYYDGGQYQRALQQFDKALEKEPGDLTARLGRAFSLLQLAEGQLRARQPEGAENVQLAMAALEELAPDVPDSQAFKVELGLGQAHARMGDLYENRANLLAAQADLRPAGGPEVVALEEARGKAYEHREQAAAHFHSVLGTEENKPAQSDLTSLIELARLAVIKRRYEEAYLYATRYLDQVRRSKDLWSESIRRFPEDRAIWEAKLAGAVYKEVEVRDLLANVLYKLGRLEEAKGELERLILLSPERGDAYLNRAIISEELGQKAEAVEDLKAFLVRAAEIEMDPSDPRAVEATRRLMRLESELGLEPTIPTSAGR
jgi:tetratricopeptide (TPR) repeat protein